MPRQDPSNARAISLILALSIVAGSWLAFEYSNRPTAPVTPAQPSTEVARSPEPPVQISPQSPAKVGTQAPRDANLTYRCQKNGQTSFGDQPCGSEATLVSVMADERRAPDPDDRLARMKRAAAQMEADHLARERTPNAVIAVQSTESKPSNAAQCKFIDDQIAQVDAWLRQPHSAQEGDYWTERRKKLMDERFDLRC